MASALRAHAPDHIADIVGHQHRAVAVECDTDWAAKRIAVRAEEAGQDIDQFGPLRLHTLIDPVPAETGSLATSVQAARVSAARLSNSAVERDRMGAPPVRVDPSAAAR